MIIIGSSDWLREFYYGSRIFGFFITQISRGNRTRLKIQESGPAFTDMHDVADIIATCYGWIPTWIRLDYRWKRSWNVRWWKYHLLSVETVCYRKRTRLAIGAKNCSVAGSRPDGQRFENFTKFYFKKWIWSVLSVGLSVARIISKSINILLRTSQQPNFGSQSH